MADIISLDEWKDNDTKTREWDDPCIGCHQYMSCVNTDVCQEAQEWASRFWGRYKQHGVYNIFTKEVLYAR